MPVIALTKPQKLQAAIQRATRQAKIDCMDYKIKRYEISEITGVDPSAISHQLNGDNCMTLPTYLAIQMLIDERKAGAD